MNDTINIGVLAHVDAGKTTLTEQILYQAGVIEKAGSVDQGSTITDSLDMERRRGITIKAAAVSFILGDLKVNLIDTPGHADFISEVEHSLGVLDGVILVVSAVEGVQAQTRVLMRTLQEHGIPVLFFVNKIDRMGADFIQVCASIRELLDDRICEVSIADHEGTESVQVVQADPAVSGWIEVLALGSESLMEDFAQDAAISEDRLRQELGRQSRQGLAFPLFAGSAAKGLGVRELLSGLSYFFPVQESQILTTLPLTGLAFKVIVQAGGERLVFVRLFGGRLQARAEVTVIAQDGLLERIKIKQLYGLMDGERKPVQHVDAGDIAIFGSEHVQVGDVIGCVSESMKVFRFQKPPIQVQVSAVRPEDGHPLHLALSELTVEDPFLQYVYDAHTHENIIHVFGKVQQEVLLETLREKYSIEAAFSAPQVICIEKPVSSGEAAETIGEPDNPFWATVGFRVEPGPADSGLVYRLEVELGSLPLSFQKAIRETVAEVLREGLHGWGVTDITVTLTDTGYSSPVSTAKDFRLLTPLVLMKALDRAGTQVYEPVSELQISLPESSISKVLFRITALDGTFEEPKFDRGSVYVTGTIPVRNADVLKTELHGLTGGAGVMSVKPGGYVPAVSPTPVNQRRQLNPLHRGDYMLHINKVR
ncbi:translation factor GTPase family protein [Paenibacillus sp. XY044]|uniref:elongation factor G n=1 Tax=Paenibacillus sp. XY044 TaxID=2026089 RepID=UPI000B9875C4|nr:TetM/TetW/TetO/TetS family tetracycline resistance ribosomal protection protein [Paenibacillus sp. XY044]OZB98636.1 tetracycline resistance protein [Paenibacillus sp. XY044]